MPYLAERQRAFAAALLDPEAPMPEGLLGPDGAPSARRFAVYRNNVLVGLIDAMRTTFPAVCRIVGEEFFQAMVRAFVVERPPRSPILIDYGSDFADFISTFPPAASLPYLADVARIENAWKESFHSADVDPLDADRLADVSADDVAGLVLEPHPSLRLVASRFPALTIWRMNVDEGEPRPVDLSVAEDCLVVRPAADVVVHFVPAGGAAFVQALMQGATLGEAARHALKAEPRFDLAASLAGLLAAGAFIAFRLLEQEDAR